jgi:hypothetical protein
MPCSNRPGLTSLGRRQSHAALAPEILDAFTKAFGIRQGTYDDGTPPHE